MKYFNLKNYKYFKHINKYVSIKKKFIKKLILFDLLIIFYICLNYSKTEKSIIPVVFAVNDKYAYPLIVLMTSILYNSSINTHFIFYILISPDVKKNKIKRILSLKDKYKNCEMKLIYMGKYFSNYNFGYYKTAAVYYRLALSNLITDVNKIIYLDIDTIVHRDLSQLYNINMGNYYYMGAPALDLIRITFNGTRNFINSGVLLINLKKLREIKATKLFEDYYLKYGTKKHDEYLINAIFYDKISFLPLEYGIPDFGEGSLHTSTPTEFWKSFKNFINFTKYDMENASLNRAITHNTYERKKWWNKNYDKLTKIGKQWLFYASKTNMFYEICKSYNQFKKECNKIERKLKFEKFI